MTTKKKRNRWFKEGMTKGEMKQLTSLMYSEGNLGTASINIDELVSFINKLKRKEGRIAYSNGAEDMFNDIKSVAIRAGDLYQWVHDMQIKINKQ
jgi:hypothetical protein